jgi:hypothetical protein
MKERTIAAQAAELLAGLGDTPDEIAAMLLGAGYKGVQKNSAQCPCGSCLADHFGEELHVKLAPPGPAAVVDARFENRCVVAEHVTQFVLAFDAGKYPQLVARP